MSKKKKVFLIIFIVIALAAVVAFIFGKKYRDFIFAPNVVVENEPAYIHIPNGSDYDDLLLILEESGYIENMESFKQVADWKKYGEKVLPGRYEIHDGMSNNELINLLRSGKQSPVKLSFISVRSLPILAGKVAVYIEADSTEIADLLMNPETAAKYGFNEQTFPAMFIPNTYEFYWNTSADKFVERMAQEFKNFWNADRIQKAQDLGMSQSEVSTMASIVEKETQKNDEKARIAGVYINRIQKGMLLQADPTVVFAVGDFTLQRVLKRHLQYDSPYNTYIYEGLPPGPICIPSTSSIDAVLNYENHSYYYFCANSDFSGYHVFASSLSQHNANARKYHNALRQAGIR
ncbi:MAG: endolytic transglycosylase MltG [Marinilabiliales bacterium]|nr:MAG: endolytic transglycosylase MltG [Marinilabiliales bacterium]